MELNVRDQTDNGKPVVLPLKIIFNIVNEILKLKVSENKH